MCTFAVTIEYYVVCDEENQLVCIYFYFSRPYYSIRELCCYYSIVFIAGITSTNYSAALLSKNPKL